MIDDSYTHCCLCLLVVVVLISCFYGGRVVVGARGGSGGALQVCRIYNHFQSYDITCPHTVSPALLVSQNVIPDVWEWRRRAGLSCSATDPSCCFLLHCLLCVCAWLQSGDNGTNTEFDNEFLADSLLAQPTAKAGHLTRVDAHAGVVLRLMLSYRSKRWFILSKTRQY